MHHQFCLAFHQMKRKNSHKLMLQRMYHWIAFQMTSGVLMMNDCYHCSFYFKLDCFISPLLLLCSVGIIIFFACFLWVSFGFVTYFFYFRLYCPSKFNSNIVSVLFCGKFQLIKFVHIFFISIVSFWPRLTNMLLISIVVSK